jgi:DNA-binding phage protein
MAGYITPKHAEAKENLILDMRTHIKGHGGIQWAASKMGMDDRDLAKILRLDRTVSLSKLEEMGSAIGIKLVMRWEK